MPIHRIRLNGPWQYEWQGTPPKDLPVVAAGEVVMPTTWEAAFGRCVGTVVLRRRFHRPTNLEPHERVWIAISRADAVVRVQLNGEPLEKSVGRSERFKLAELREFNELQVEVRGGLFSGVAIEIDAGEPSA